ncbi:hypothetical protein BHE74_00004365 [Ensete ventricosum]|nr:hypothetical protein BHE74_00004365 [Ensete ventricosum]
MLLTESRSCLLRATTATAAVVAESSDSSDDSGEQRQQQWQRRAMTVVAERANGNDNDNDNANREKCQRQNHDPIAWFNPGARPKPTAPKLEQAQMRRLFEAHRVDIERGAWASLRLARAPRRALERLLKSLARSRNLLAKPQQEACTPNEAHARRRNIARQSFSPRSTKKPVGKDQDRESNVESPSSSFSSPSSSFSLD